MIKDSIWFLCAVAAANVLCIAWYNEATAPRSWTRQTMQQYEALPGMPRMLVLGDSHAKCSVDPAIINGAFNAATLGGQYFHGYARLQEMLDKKTGRPEMLLLAADTHSLAWQEGRQEETDFWAWRLNWPRLAYYSESPFDTLGRYAVEAVLPYRGNGDRMIAAFLDDETSGLPYPMRSGFVELPGDWSHLSEEAQADKAADQTAFLHDEYAMVNPVLVHYLEKILRLCRDESIGVVFVRFPITEESRAAVAANASLEPVNAVFDELGQKYGVVAQLDFSALFDGAPEMFSDSHHVNARGAAAFSRALQKELAALSRGQ